MYAARQADIPVYLIGVLCSGENLKGFAAARAALPTRRQLMEYFFRGKVRVPLAAIAFRARLFAAFLWLFALKRGSSGSFQSVVGFFTGARICLFGFPAEQLLFQPGHPRLQFLVYLKQHLNALLLPGATLFKFANPLF